MISELLASLALDDVAVGEPVTVVEGVARGVFAALVGVTVRVGVGATVSVAKGVDVAARVRLGVGVDVAPPPITSGVGVKVGPTG